jgi:hypothetical protein
LPSWLTPNIVYLIHKVADEVDWGGYQRKKNQNKRKSTSPHADRRKKKVERGIRIWLMRVDSDIKQKKLQQVLRRKCPMKAEEVKKEKNCGHRQTRDYRPSNLLQLATP